MAQSQINTFISLKITIVWSVIILVSSMTVYTKETVQGIHILDPSIDDFKYYSSWNSDQWIQWVRNRYEDDLKDRQNFAEEPQSPLYGSWVNIILITSADEMNSAFSENSTPTYTTGDEAHKDYYWSDFPFPVYAVVRKNAAKLTEEANADIVASQYNVFKCLDKKMFINAKIDLDSFNPLVIKTLFPKKVKNPLDKLKIPLVTCNKVSQVRGLLDEIRFQFRS